MKRKNTSQYTTIMRIIKQLREKKGVKQPELAEAIGVSPRTIQLYERENANIPIKNLTKIATYFDLSIAELYLKEFNDFRSLYTNKKQSFAKHGSVFYPLDHGKHLVMTPLILLEEYEKYIENIRSSIPEKNAFQIGFVLDTVEEETHRAFEISGDSMNDQSIQAIPNKAIVLALNFNKELFTVAGVDPQIWSQHYVLVCQDRITCKQVIEFDKQKASIRCHNLNPSPEYQDFEVPLEDLLQVFRVIKKQL